MKSCFCLLQKVHKAEMRPLARLQEQEEEQEEQEEEDAVNGVACSESRIFDEAKFSAPMPPHKTKLRAAPRGGGAKLYTTAKLQRYGCMGNSG